MRLLVRAGLLIIAAGGLCVALSLTASADVVEPSSPYQPASTSLMEQGPKGAEHLRATAASPTAGEAPTATTSEPVVQAAPATPAPEPEVRPAPAHIVRRQAPEPEPSGLERVVRPFSAGFERIGAYLGRVVSACQVATGSGAGVPVLALAVLSVAAALNRRWVFGTRSATDEDVPELLLSAEVIAPG